LNETELFKEAWRGDKEAQSTLYSIAHKYLLAGEAEKAATCFKELAQAHKHGTFIAKSELEILENQARKHKAEIQIYTSWLKRHLNAFAILPLQRRLDAMEVRRIVRKLCAEPKLEAEYRYLNRTFHRYDSDLYDAIATYFGVSHSRCLYLKDVNVRVALDNIVDFYIKKMW
jgi:predicted Zn-dependent protease